jgi:hypothetical protein
VGQFLAVSRAADRFCPVRDRLAEAMQGDLQTGSRTAGTVCDRYHPDEIPALAKSPPALWE